MLKTGKETQLGQEIKIGDILKGKNTTYILVMINTHYEHLGRYMTSTIEYKIKDTIFGTEKICTIKDSIFDLDDIIKSWSDLEIVDNIITV